MNLIHVLILAVYPLLISNVSASAVLLETSISQDGKLERARKLLASSPEQEVRDGARICVELNSVASVEELLNVLNLTANRGLAAAHYRDVCWEALRDITDPYARKRVEQELKENKGSERVRQWCAELLGLYAGNEFGESLTKALGDKSDDVRAAAARALGRIKYTQAQKGLLKRIKSKDTVLRANAIEALALIDPTANEKTYLKGLEDKDGGVRCALYAIALVAYPDQAEALSTTALDDDDWRPRLQGCDNLAGIKTKTAVDALLEAFDDERAVVVVRAISSLQKLTHQKLTRADQWKKWWERSRETFDFPEGRIDIVRADPNATVSVFNGIRLDSGHVAFLLDKSAKMGDFLSSRDMSKDDAAHEELKGVLDALQGELVFNIFCYDIRVRPFSEKGSVKLTKTTAKKALAFHEKAPISGRKDIWAALMAVLEDPKLDTAYLLSSGEPDIGLYVHWPRVTYQLKELNRFHKVVFHTVAYSDSEWDRSQLEKIAEATGGEFQWFE
ncbi:MAG: hypothetical protein ACI8X5_002194 [Planctomycetota bacterium]|jgi:hypothetical protein